MSTYKNIYWRNDVPRNAEGLRFANVHLLVGYNQGCISDFMEMVLELQETFPQSSLKDIGASKVVTSSSVKGFSIVTWNAYIPEGEYEGWYQYNKGIPSSKKSRDSVPEYFWA